MNTESFGITFALTALLLITALGVAFVFKSAVSQSTMRNKLFPIIFLILVWIVDSILSLKGVFLDTIKSTPPVFFPAVIVMLSLAVYFALKYEPLTLFKKENLKYAVALQTFRFPLELIFVWAFHLGLMPKQMTFEGLNFEVLVGLTAPLVAYFGYHKQVLPKWVLVGWNFAGLLLLANIVTVAILSAPTNFQVFTNEPHNTIVFKFPYIFIPFFLVPLALFGHLFALRKLLAKN
ncbi:hypothetical protein QQ054_35040 [Oscillatoria amoena NRMC-F 0135]|nr:hypothetical protein [Oscillatoria amoena NRMC-F 0135]